MVISLMVQIGAWFGAESFEIRLSLTSQCMHGMTVNFGRQRTASRS